MTGNQALVFATSCAERLLPLAELEPSPSVTIASDALEQTWQLAISGSGSANELRSPLEELVHRDARATTEPSYEADAAVCLIYGLEALTATEPDACARRASRRSHEVVDSIVRWRDDVDLSQPDAQDRLLTDPLVAGELEKQERDRDALTSGDATDVISRLRAESAELGARYAAEVAAIRNRHHED
jgi:hypothetical protein